MKVKNVCKRVNQPLIYCLSAGSPEPFHISHKGYKSKGCPGQRQPLLFSLVYLHTTFGQVAVGEISDNIFSDIIRDFAADRIPIGIVGIA